MSSVTSWCRTTLTRNTEFVVLSLLILKPDTGDALFSSAGAEPLLVVRSGGEAEVVSRPALALGIERDTQYEDTPLRLEPGDTTVQVTDGITEARNGSDLLGYPAMVEIVRQALQASSLQAAGEEILAKAQAHARGKLSDDVCLILARRTGN